MNREETKKAVAIMQAYVDGETVERRDVCYPPPNWEVVNSGVVWNFARYEYRIKPKPREFWIVADIGNDKPPHVLTMDEYERHFSGDSRFIKVIEVTGR